MLGGCNPVGVPLELQRTDQAGRISRGIKRLCKRNRGADAWLVFRRNACPKDMGQDFLPSAAEPGDVGAP